MKPISSVLAAIYRVINAQLAYVVDYIDAGWGQILYEV